MTRALSRQETQAALDELDQLSREEYNQSLEELLGDPDRALSSQKMARLSGIVVKRRFAQRSERPQGVASYTNANYLWKWEDTSTWPQGPERDLLERVRQPGPWNTIWDRERSGVIARTTPWPWFTDEADHERGLFKIVALYVKDKLAGEQRRTLGEYYRMNEPPGLRRGLDTATAVFDSTVLAPILGITGIPALAVAMSLMAIEYGFEKLIEPEDRGDEPGA
jgi:hypothetical protein